MLYCCCADFSGRDSGSGHITNYAQNENGDVWSLQQLATHMGASAWKVRLGLYTLLVTLVESKQL
jgi:hypothetical protein